MDTVGRALDLTEDAHRCRSRYKVLSGRGGLLRARLRMVLEALEDDLRTDYGEGQPAPHRPTVEHISPQARRQNWPIASDDPTAALDRDRLVHVLGNLTLVSGRLNPAVSNRPWTDGDGAGKRDYLLRHSILKLNAKVVAEHPTAWSEDDIHGRTVALAKRLLAIWPRPMAPASIPVPASAFDPQVVVPDPNGEDEVAAPSHTGKYQRLWRWLRAQGADEIPLAFEQVEQILDMPLPGSARLHLTHWYGYEGTALGRAIRDAGWRASNVNLAEQRLTSIRADGDAGDA